MLLLFTFERDFRAFLMEQNNTNVFCVAICDSIDKNYRDPYAVRRLCITVFTGILRSKTADAQFHKIFFVLYWNESFTPLYVYVDRV